METKGREIARVGRGCLGGEAYIRIAGATVNTRADLRYSGVVYGVVYGVVLPSVPQNTAYFVSGNSNPRKPTRTAPLAGMSPCAYVLLSCISYIYSISSVYGILYLLYIIIQSTQSNATTTASRSIPLPSYLLPPSSPFHRPSLARNHSRPLPHPPWPPVRAPCNPPPPAIGGLPSFNITRALVLPSLH